MLLFNRSLRNFSSYPAMNVPDLSQALEAGVRDWSGPPDALKSAAAAAKLRVCQIDLHGVGGKSELMAALGKRLKLPEHFSSNWDALADSLEDSDWREEDRLLMHLRHAAAYRNGHPRACENDTRTRDS